MSLNALLNKIKTQPELVSFNEVMSFIADHYNYSATRFTNGEGEDCVTNEAGTNEGSCKIFAFAQINGLTEAETLACFGDYYRQDVLAHPSGTDHANIRTFMKHGWASIHFDQPPLSAK